MTDEPKIIVDEDWKTRVTAEKEAAAHQPPADQPPPEQPPATKSDRPTSPASRPAQPLPPANLSFLITTLATQAMMALGEVPHPLTGKAELRLPEAQHFIDVLAMLEDKTAGHRTPEESALLDSFLHQLRLAYVELQAQPAAGVSSPIK